MTQDVDWEARFKELQRQATERKNMGKPVAPTGATGKPPSPLNSALNMGAAGLTGGALPWIEGGLDKVAQTYIPQLAKLLEGAGQLTSNKPLPEPSDQSLMDFVTQAQDRLKGHQETNPIASTVGEVGGLLASPLTKANAGMVSSLPSAVGRIFGASGGAAAESALFDTLMGNPQEEIIQNAGVAGIMAPGAQGLAEVLAPSVQRFSPTSAAGASRAADTLLNKVFGPLGIGPEEADKVMRGIGPDARLADVSPTSQGAASSLMGDDVLDPKSVRKVMAFMTRRQEEVPETIRNKMKEAFGTTPISPNRVKAAIGEVHKGISQEYNKVFDRLDADPNMSLTGDDVIGMMDYLFTDQRGNKDFGGPTDVIDGIRYWISKNVRSDKGPIKDEDIMKTPLKPSQLQALKQYLDKSIGGQFRINKDNTIPAYDKNYKRALTMARKAINGFLSLDDEYKTLNTRYGNAASAERAYEEGYKLMQDKTNLTDFEDLMEDMEPGDTQFFLQGVTAKLADLATSGDSVKEAKALLRKPGIKEKLAAVGGQDYADTLLDGIMNDLTRLQTAKPASEGKLTSSGARAVSSAIQSRSSGVLDKVYLMGVAGATLAGAGGRPVGALPGAYSGASFGAARRAMAGVDTAQADALAAMLGMKREDAVELLRKLPRMARYTPSSSFPIGHAVGAGQINQTLMDE